MGPEVLLVALALIPLAALLGLYLYITHGARTSARRRLQRNRRALRKARRRSRQAAADPGVVGDARAASDPAVVGEPGVVGDLVDDNYLDHADPSDAYFDGPYLDDDGALARGLLEDEVDISRWPENHEDYGPDTDR